MSGKRLGVRGIPSTFIKIYERGRDTPYPQPLALYYRVRTYLPEIGDRCADRRDASLTLL